MLGHIFVGHKEINVSDIHPALCYLRNEVRKPSFHSPASSAIFTPSSSAAKAMTVDCETPLS